MFFKVIPWKVLYNPKGYKGFSVENVSKILNFPKPRDLYFFIIWKKKLVRNMLKRPNLFLNSEDLYFFVIRKGFLV